MMSWRIPTGLGAALALAAGALFLRDLSPAATLGLAAAGAGALCARTRRSRGRGHLWFSLIAVAALGLAAGSIRAPATELPALPAVRDARLAGKVTAWRVTPYGVSARMELHRAGDTAFASPPVLRLYAPASWGDAPGSGWLRFAGDLEPDRGPTNPGAWADPRARGTLRPTPVAVPEWGPTPPDRLYRWREALAGRSREVLPGFPGRLAVAMLLGRSGVLTSEERTSFRRAGASHLVAVSGLHVGLVASLVALTLATASRGIRWGAITLATWGYAALAGGSASALRAATLITLHGAGSALGRTRSGMGWLALALPWLLWANPDLLRSVSFLLSVGAVSGILLALELAGSISGGRSRILGAASVCLGAQWGTLPTALAVFGAVSPLALAPNLLAVPLAGLFLPAVLAAVATDGLPGLGSLSRDAALGLGYAVGRLLQVSGERLPFVSGWAAPPPLVLALFPLLVLVWFTLPETRRRSRGTRITGSFLAAGVVALCFLPREGLPGPWVAFLDVGQGDASVVRLSDGTVWVVDTGDDRGPGDAAKNAILPFLRTAHIREVDGLILTHRHRDHVGALGPLLAGVAVHRVFETGWGPADGVSGRVDSVLAAHGLWPCLVAAGDTLHAGPGAALTAVHPPRLGSEAGWDQIGLNDTSLMTRVSDGPLTVLFAGDAETHAETVALASALPLRARVLQAGHHGSDTSSGESFLRAVGAQWTVVSCGRGNRYGHPAPEVVKRLANLGGRVHRTDLEGALWLHFDARGEWVARVFPPRPDVSADSLSSQNAIW